MFFAVVTKRALLCDLNEELINAYRFVGWQPKKLLQEIRKIPVDSNTYCKMRDYRPRSAMQRAIRFVYLNRTSYGGLYRKNRDGLFNVPYSGGCRTTVTLWARNSLTKLGNLLCNNRIRLSVGDFEKQIDKARGSDIYCWAFKATSTVIESISWAY